MYSYCPCTTRTNLIRKHLTQNIKQKYLKKHAKYSDYTMLLLCMRALYVILSSMCSSGRTTATTVLQPLYRSTHVRLQLRRILLVLSFTVHMSLQMATNTIGFMRGKTKENTQSHHQPTSSTQPCIPLGSLNRVRALIGWGKCGNVTSAGWQVTLCDPIWHVSSRSGEACCELLYPVTLLYFTSVS